jgi:hypothetical protein
MTHDLKIVNQQQAAELLGVPVRTLVWWRQKAIRKGPKFIKYENGTVRYRLRDLEAYLDEKTVETESKVSA